VNASPKREQSKPVKIIQIGREGMACTGRLGNRYLMRAGGKLESKRQQRNAVSVEAATTFIFTTSFLSSAEGRTILGI
jgi:hypothetical protein